MILLLLPLKIEYILKYITVIGSHWGAMAANCLEEKAEMLNLSFKYIPVPHFKIKKNHFHKSSYVDSSSLSAVTKIDQLQSSQNSCT